MVVSGTPVAVVIIFGTSDTAADDASWAEAGLSEAGVTATLDDGFCLDDGCLLLDDAAWVGAGCVDAG